jgi:hypothetical protein
MLVDYQIKLVERNCLLFYLALIILLKSKERRTNELDRTEVLEVNQAPSPRRRFSCGKYCG